MLGKICNTYTTEHSIIVESLNKDDFSEMNYTFKYDQRIELRERKHFKNYENRNNYKPLKTSNEIIEVMPFTPLGSLSGGIEIDVAERISTTIQTKKPEKHLVC